MDMEKLAAIFEAVKVLPLRPSDKIVLKLSEGVTDEVIARLQAEFCGHKVIVLTSGIDIEILREEAEITPETAARIRAQFEAKYTGARL